MTNFSYLTNQERYRPVGVSIEAQLVSQNVQNSHDIFIGQSVFNQAMYKIQLKKNFDFYNSIWRNDTMFSSSISEITNNAAYQSIIGLGKDVIPFILTELKESNNHWFYALEALTGQNPIKKEHRGIVQLMKTDWIEWAMKNNKINES